MSVQVLGIRHHGPGSARSLVLALQRYEPDMILLEGPPEGDPLIPLVVHPDMRPPVALLIYPAERTEDEERRGAYYPFADFSPEWNALRYALSSGIEARFMDLPQSHQLAVEEDFSPGVDALGELAQAAGHSDGEEWWEAVVERRGDEEVFAGILEAMAAVRQGHVAEGREARREAWMRRTIRQAQKEGRKRIAVVCGAWHAPALLPANWPGAAHDEQLLKGLARRKVEATWVPWTYDRLSFATGYGAGVESPEYYHLLWDRPQDVAVHWMVSAAQLLRSQDLPASPASAVEAVRLAEALAVMRGRALPALAELQEAARSVYCQGRDLPMQLIHRKLVLGERLGSIPSEAPQVPLARDVATLQKRLRLAPEASHRDVDLDLRKPNERERSFLLHRLNLLEVGWGELREARGSGTFRESWRLQWKPEFSLDLVQAARWGNTVVEAAAAFTSRQAQERDLSGLTRLAESVLLADLPAALDEVLRQLQARAALASDPGHLLEALPPFARILRYPDVRQTDATMLRQVVGGMVERIAVGLPLACSSLDDEAAQAMLARLLPAHTALMTLNDSPWLENWRATLLSLANLSSLHGLLAGRATWILLDINHFDQSEATRRLGLALSLASQASQAASWVEGFLRDNGELLVHTPDLFRVLDEWISALSPERFTEVLPLVRRTFSSFSAGVRRNLGSVVTTPALSPRSSGPVVDHRARAVLPVVRRLLGIAHE